MKILVAEDNDSNYLLVRAILKGYDLTRAMNGQEAVDLALGSDFDIVLMDMKMPLMDGLEATRLIRSQKADLPIYAVTANAFDSDRINAIDAGCNGFVTKPLKKNELITLIQDVENSK